mmetsp:Transcript_4257/g.6346  ORF Transcript_4257/g.6346 Transcript_4257/m.6346 type:complete len:335 (-) Transcript_4257:38-1042(-)
MTPLLRQEWRRGLARCVFGVFLFSSLLFSYNSSVLNYCNYASALGSGVEVNATEMANVTNSTITVRKSKLIKLPPPIVVVGAELRIASLIIIGLSERGERVIAITRDDESPDSMIIKLTYGVHYVRGDISKPETFSHYFKNAKAVIFACQARSVYDQDREAIRFTGGETPKGVEFRGIRSIARSAVAKNVPRIFLLSMYMVTRKKSPEYRWLNKFQRAMYWKRRAELELINQCRKSKGTSKYTIIRAGGSAGEKGKGLEKVVLRQGDYLKGTLPLEDLASITVESLYHNATEDTVFEAVTGDEGIALGFERLNRGNDGSAVECPDEDKALISDE